MMRKFTAAAIFGVGVALLSAGCSNIHELNKALGEASNADEVSTIGLNIVPNKTTQKEVVASIGAPSMVFDEENGSTWVYSRVAVRNTGSGGKLAANFTAFFPYKAHQLNHGGGLTGVGASASVASERSSYKTAALMIHFNGEGCAVNYEFTATSF